MGCDCGVRIQCSSAVLLTSGSSLAVAQRGGFILHFILGGCAVPCYSQKSKPYIISVLRSRT